MALNNSGKISLAGSTAGESVALELSKSATGMISMNDTDVRTLAGISTGMIQLDDFYGKSSGLGYFISSVTLPTGYSSPSLIYADNSFFMSILSETTSGTPGRGTLVLKINSDFTSYSITPNQIESIYGAYNSGLATINRRYQFTHPIYDGNRLIYATQIQKQSAGSSNSCGDVGLIEWDTTTNSYVRSIQFGHYYSSGTVTGPVPYFLHKSFDGNFYRLLIRGNTNLNPRGFHNLNKSDFTHNSAVTTTTDYIHAAHGNIGILHPYKTASAQGYWYGSDYYSSSTSTSNRFKLRHVDSNFNQIGVISEIAATYLDSVVGNNQEIFILSRINGSTRTTAYFQKFNASGSLIWTKSFTVGTNFAQGGANFIHSSDGYIYINLVTGQSVSKVFKLDYDGNIIFGRGIAFSSTATVVAIRTGNGVNQGLNLSVKFTTNDLLLNANTDGPTCAAYFNVTGGIKYMFMKLSSSFLNVGTYTVNGETITVTDQTSSLSFGSSAPAAGAALSLTISYITELQSNSHTYSARTPSGITVGKTNV